MNLFHRIFGRKAPALTGVPPTRVHVGMPKAVVRPIADPAPGEIWCARDEKGCPFIFIGWRVDAVKDGWVLYHLVSRNDPLSGGWVTGKTSTQRIPAFKQTKSLWKAAPEPGSTCIAGAMPLTRAQYMADIILTQMDHAGLRSGKGTPEDPMRPNWQEMSEWCGTALAATVSKK